MKEFNCKNYFNGDELHIGGKLVIEEGADTNIIPVPAEECSATTVANAVKYINAWREMIINSGIGKVEK